MIWESKRFSWNYKGLA